MRCSPTRMTIVQDWWRGISWRRHWVLIPGNRFLSWDLGGFVTSRLLLRHRRPSCGNWRRSWPSAAEAEHMLEPFQLSWNQTMQQIHISIPAFTIPPGPFVLPSATQPALFVTPPATKLARFYHHQWYSPINMLARMRDIPLWVNSFVFSFIVWAPLFVTVALIWTKLIKT